MRLSFKVLFSFFLIIFFSSVSNGQNQEFYQIKMFSFESDRQMERMDNYLEYAFLPALKRQGFQNIGVFKPRLDSIKKIYILIPFSSLNQFESIENKLMTDGKYQNDGSNFIKVAHDKPNYNRLESILLKAFEEMPQLKPSPLNGPREDRIYELRSYESATESLYRNKVDMFNAGGEIELFEQLKFNAVFYGEVISGAKMPNLMYMTTHENDESRQQNWKNFGNSSEWDELKSMKKYQKNVSHIDKYFLYPTEYSDY